MNLKSNNKNEVMIYDRYDTINKKWHKVVAVWKDSEEEAIMTKKKIDDCLNEVGRYD